MAVRVLHLGRHLRKGHAQLGNEHHRVKAETALAAAEPHIRAKIAAEIEAVRLGGNAWDYDGGLETAARIARGEQP